MPSYRSNGNAPSLPARTREYLAHGAPEGTRNMELFDAACQFRDAGHSQEATEAQLVDRALADGLTEAEARHTIRSAFTQGAREPAGFGAHRTPGTPAAPAATPQQVPQPPDDGFLRLMDACFADDELVSIATATEDDDGEWVPRRGVTLTAAEWKKRVAAKGGIDRVFSARRGLWVRINPMCQDGCRNEEVTSLRHVLVEFDRDQAGKPIPKADQYRAIVESGLPVSAVIDSGNKSLHAWVRVDAPNENEYRRRVDAVWKLFESKNLDRQNRNPSRLSRCPDGWRTVDGEPVQQRLLATGLGAASWDSWEQGRSKAEPPPFVDLRPFIENGCQPERPGIADVGLDACMLYAGRLNEIHGEPGTGKSNVAIAMCIAELNAGHLVLFIDPEDTPAGFTRRALQFGADPAHLIDRCRYLHNPTPEELGAAQCWARREGPALVILDGLAESMAAEGLVEDKAPDVLKFFRERLRPFAEESGAAVLVSDHVAKNSEERGRWARGSGAKLGRYDGVSYKLALIEAYSPQHAGAVRLTIAKDRNGGVGRVGDAVAEVHFAPAESDRTTVSFRKPEASGTFRPTTIMAKIVAHLKEHKEATKRELRSLGKSQAVDLALGILAEEGGILLAQNGRKHVYSLPSPCVYRMREKSA